MKVAVGMWTLVIGGWALPAVAVSDDAPSPRAGRMPAVESGSRMQGPLGSPADQRPLSPRRDGRSYGSPRAGRQVAPSQPYMPLPPTDPAAATGAYPLLPPTGYSSPGYGGPGTLPGSAAQGRTYQRPTHYRRPDSSYAARQATERAARAAQMRTKPFSSYRPAPSVSPYLNLFRFEDSEAFSNINTYYTMVKPFVDQRYANLQFGGEIRGLQSTSRFQSTALQHLGQETQFMQGTAQPQYYMNYQDYYPGLGD